LLAVSGVASAQNGLIGDYYNTPGSGNAPPPPPGSPAGTTFVGAPTFTQTDATVDFAFPMPPATGVTQDHFMVAWTGYLTITLPGTYQLNLRSDDGCRLWLDGNTTPVISAWNDQGGTDHIV